MLEVFNNLFMSIAEQMGVSLQNTAYSVNIKERLDFSCAVFAADGTLVANAPHMPVHLGSMDRAVETIIRENKGAIAPVTSTRSMRPTTAARICPTSPCARRCSMTPRENILFWVAIRGHHADVGGISPGSMSPNATTIDEEGVYIDNFKLVERGRFRETELHALLTGARYPARNPLQNINDLKAQIAANEKGVQELRKMVRSSRLPVVNAYMQHVQDNAAESVRRVIDALHDCAFAYEMDQGTVIKVKITVDKQKREATVDFTGTSPQQPTNFNAPEPVTRAAVLYVFRVMVDDDIPMNAGCLRPINIIIPKRSHAVAGISRRRGRRQCRDLAGRDQLPVRRARRARGRARHHEQSQFRQRPLSVLRDDLLGLAGRSGISRHRRRAHPHDQHAADRSGDSGVPLSGRAGGFPHPQRFWRARQMECRRRHPPHHPFSGEDGLHDPVGPPPRAAVRARRRRGRSDRRELRCGATDGRMERLARLRRDSARRRRSDHHPDADGGRLWRARSQILRKRRRKNDRPRRPPSDFLQPSYACWIAESSQLPPRSRRKVHTSVATSGWSSPSTTRPVARSSIWSMSENCIATVA